MPVRSFCQPTNQPASLTCRYRCDFYVFASFHCMFVTKQFISFNCALCAINERPTENETKGKQSAERERKRDFDCSIQHQMQPIIYRFPWKSSLALSNLLAFISIANEREKERTLFLIGESIRRYGGWSVAFCVSVEQKNISALCERNGGPAQ